MKNKELEKARKDYKEKERKLRKTIFKHNHDGIAEHGLAWIHMNHSTRLRTFKRLVETNSLLPTEVIRWAQDRGLMPL